MKLFMNKLGNDGRLLVVTPSDDTVLKTYLLSYDSNPV